ncbi:hypothetical protein [Campylobacter jejuni]|uniref:hypothetical protein n=1 Tax=Campylobacter jejuni TaxID=197 RepID=UPI0021AEDDF1|nr:hypothetical protein [Campylobacter jejuni]
MSKKTKRQIEDEKDYGGRSLFDLIELEFSQGEENEIYKKINLKRGTSFKY